MVTVPFANFEPDKNRYNVSALPTAVNVVPLVDGWGPLQSVISPTSGFVYVTDIDGNRLTDIDGNRLIAAPGGGPFSGASALPADALGLFAARKANGTEIIFAGTATKLYSFNTASYTWDDVSGVAAPYAAAVRWSFIKFGSVVYCQNGFNIEQKFNIETDVVFSNNATAPICKYLAVVGSFVFRGNIVSWASESITNAPNMIQCSAIENPDDNVPQNFNYSDFQSIPTGDEVMGFAPVSGGVHVWMRSALHGVTLTLQSEYTFSRAPIDEMRGTSSPYSIGFLGQDDYVVYCDDGFYRFSGGSFQPIGSGTVNNWFGTNSDPDERENLVAMPDPEHSIIWNAYTDTNSVRKMLGYHYVFNRWTTSDVSLQASARIRTFIYTNSVPPISNSDVLRFALINSDRQFGYLVGGNLPASVVTNEASFSTNRSFVNSAYLNGDSLTFTITPSTTDARGGSFRTRSSSTPSSRTGIVPMGAEGQTHRFQLDTIANEDWTNVTGLEISATPAGQ